MDKKEEKLYTVETISELENVHPETVRRWIREGRLNISKKRGPNNSQFIERVEYEKFTLQKENKKNGMNDNFTPKQIEIIASLRKFFYENDGNTDLNLYVQQDRKPTSKSIIKEFNGWIKALLSAGILPNINDLNKKEVLILLEYISQGNK